MFIGSCFALYSLLMTCVMDSVEKISPMFTLQALLISLYFSRLYENINECILEQSALNRSYYYYKKTCGGKFYINKS